MREIKEGKIRKREGEGERMATNRGYIYRIQYAGSVCSELWTTRGNYCCDIIIYYLCSNCNNYKLNYEPKASD